MSVLDEDDREFIAIWTIRFLGAAVALLSIALMLGLAVRVFVAAAVG